MKRTLFVLLLCCLVLTRTSGRQPDSGTSSPAPCFEQACAELSAMLDGQAPLSIRRAVFLPEWAYLDAQPDYTAYCTELASTAAALDRFIAANNLQAYRTGGNFALFEYFCRPYSMNGGKPFTYDFDDFSGSDDYTKLFVTKAMRTHSGQCRSLPLYYKVLAEAIGAEARITFAPQHIFIRHRDEQDSSKWVNVELTTLSLSRDLFYIEHFGIGAEAIRSKVYLNPLTDRETVAYLLSELAAGYWRRFGRLDDFILRCCEKSLEYYPQNTLALQLKGNVLNMRLMEYQKAHGEQMDAYAQALDRQWLDNHAAILRLGWTEMDDQTYQGLLHNVETDMKRRGFDSLTRAQTIDRIKQTDHR